VHEAEEAAHEEAREPPQHHHGHLPMRLTIDYLSFYLSFYLYICLSISIYLPVFIYLISIYLSIYLSKSIYLSIYLSIYIHIHTMKANRRSTTTGHLPRFHGQIDGQMCREQFTVSAYAGSSKNLKDLKEYGAYKAVTARFWPWPSRKGPEHL